MLCFWGFRAPAFFLHEYFHATTALMSRMHAFHLSVCICVFFSVRKNADVAVGLTCPCLQGLSHCCIRRKSVCPSSLFECCSCELVLTHGNGSMTELGGEERGTGASYPLADTGPHAGRRTQWRLIVHPNTAPYQLSSKPLQWRQMILNGYDQWGRLYLLVWDCVCTHAAAVEQGGGSHVFTGQLPLALCVHSRGRETQIDWNTPGNKWGKHDDSVRWARLVPKRMNRILFSFEHINFKLREPFKSNESSVVAITLIVVKACAVDG